MKMIKRKQNQAHHALPLNISGLVLSFGHNSVITGLDLQAEAGELVWVTGDSGCGKSTLLEAIAGLKEAQRGSIRIGKYSPFGLVKTGGIGAVFENDSLLEQFTVFENIALPLAVQGSSDRRSIFLRTEAMISQLGLVDEMHKSPSEISRGQSRLALVARAYVMQPAILILDDILSGVDAYAKDLLLRMLCPVNERMATVVASGNETDTRLVSGANVLELGKMQGFKYAIKT
ncbi:ATP-binding cassette domain-containing protein [Marinobacter sp. CHS3-4]|uniref:ATP-binding cassette domain-containing protein n=1 Tax=Marinobacter sp. CHS3-4 TaxID=3045174 RepID=UPI0024B60F45|nr:ATP-binding cassette domain-containing protein [Marinobacter sp. CHS3-4]MDI9245382.1 ATP-binding cassette domain-containing protein [Marinobacter sp. CHS3-4]